MERPYYSEGKYHQPQSTRISFVRSKALQIKDSASIRTNNFILRRRQNSFYNDADETSGKPNVDKTLWKRTNPMETATGTFGLELRNERGDTLAEWATSRKHKIMNTMF